jgi:hypothetical protein
MRSRIIRGIKGTYSSFSKTARTYAPIPIVETHVECAVAPEILRSKVLSAPEQHVLLQHFLHEAHWETAITRQASELEVFKQDPKEANLPLPAFILADFVESNYKLAHAAWLTLQFTEALQAFHRLMTLDKWAISKLSVTHKRYCAFAYVHKALVHREAFDCEEKAQACIKKALAISSNLPAQERHTLTPFLTQLLESAKLATLPVASAHYA